MKNNYEFPVENNIDLLRLFAASQVVLIHGLVHLLGIEPRESFGLSLLNYVPGVPLFFFLSGLLIMKSYDRASSFRDFAKNRFLRLFPALWVCVLLSLIMLIATQYLDWSGLLSFEVVAWVLTQATFLQFYNPDVFYGFGVGVINASLWTIAIEIQFYVLAPVLAYLYRYKGAYFLIFAVSIAVNLVLNQMELRELLVGKLIRVSALPWIYMFMTGHLVVANWQRFSAAFRGKAGYWLAILCVSSALSYSGDHFTSLQFGGNSLWPFHFIALCGLALSLALTMPDLSRRVLNGNDFSYGIYIYHMPVINLLIFLGISGGASSLLIAIALTAILAFASWRLIERPALRLKNYSIFQR